MPHDPARKKMIRAHLKEQEDSAGGKDALPHEKLIVKGKAESTPVYSLSIDDLAFNKANGRIKAEVLEKETELARSLSPESPQDQKLIGTILLSIRKDENEKIREDLRKNGQMRPGIITCDGIVINGNRRKALLQDLYGETGETKYKQIDVQVLPSDITKAELWLIEAGIQMSAPQQLDYSPINNLLNWRDGVLGGLKIDDMAARIYGVSKESIESDLDRLDLIDEYLKDFLRKPDRYYLVRALNEHFIDLQDILNWAKRPRGNVPMNWKPDASDLNELKLVGFYYIRIKFPHLRVRELRDLFVTAESWNEAKKVLQLDVELPEEERDTLKAALTVKEADGGEGETTAEETTFTTTVEEVDIQEEAAWREKSESTLRNFYENAKEQKQIIKDSQRPLALANRALKMLRAIPTQKEKLSEPEIDDVLREIVSHTNTLRKVIQKNPRPQKRQRPR
jgi:hypothetical protein